MLPVMNGSMSQIDKSDKVKSSNLFDILANKFEVINIMNGQLKELSELTKI